eukprot:1634422-Amphidinium_carterae.1
MSQGGSQGSSMQDVSQGLYDLHTHVGCAIHDSHNSLKWASVFGACHSFGSVLGCLPQWVLEHLRPVPEAELPPEAECRCVWSILGVSGLALEFLATSRLHWSSDSLTISDSTLAEPGWVEALSSTLLSVWKFGLWTNSRWATHPGLVGDYDVAGFERLDFEATHLLVTTALVPFPSESMVKLVLRDSRVALH